MVKVAHEYPDVLEYDQDVKPGRVFPMMARQEVTPDLPFPNGMRIAQEDTMSVLRAKLGDYNIHVECGMDLVKIEQDESGVTAIFNADDQQEIIRAAYVVAADGAKGPTRKLVGIPFLGESHEEIGMLVGDIELFGLDRVHWHKFQDAHSNWIRARAVPEKPNVFFSSFGPDLDIKRGATDKAHLQQYICAVTKHDDIAVGNVLTLQDWRMNVRMADRFRAARVLLAGDAAHVHSPLGGQGLNTGVLDVVNLAWKLALVVKRLAPLALLESYEAERKPVVADMLAFTSSIAARTFAAGASSSAWMRTRAGAQLGVHYRWSSIVRDEFKIEQSAAANDDANAYASTSDHTLQAGDRAPNATGLVGVNSEAVGLFNLFENTYHTVLLFDSAAVPDVSKMCSRFPAGLVRLVVLHPQGELSRNAGSYTDVEGHARRGYGGAGVAIVRPDGIVGALVRGADGVEAYFHEIFSEAVAA